MALSALSEVSPDVYIDSEILEVLGIEEDNQFGISRVDLHNAVARGLHEDLAIDASRVFSWRISIRAIANQDFVEFSIDNGGEVALDCLNLVIAFVSITTYDGQRLVWCPTRKEVWYRLSYTEMDTKEMMPMDTFLDTSQIQAKTHVAKYASQLVDVIKNALYSKVGASNDKAQEFAEEFVSKLQNDGPITEGHLNDTGVFKDAILAYAHQKK